MSSFFMSQMLRSKFGSVAIELCLFPAGETTLSNATTVVDNGAGGIYPYNTTFDPTSHFDISFNPNYLEDGGAWDRDVP